MLNRCPKCYQALATGPDERPRPWCPQCGLDLRGVTAAVPATPAVVAQTPHAEVIDVRMEPPRRYDPAPAACAATMTPSAGDPSAVAPADSRPASTSLENPEHVFRANLIWQAAFGLCALVCLGIAAIAASQFVRPSAAHPPKPGVLFGLIALFGGGGLASAYGGLRLLGHRYLVFPDRLVIVQNGKTTACRWDQVRDVYHSMHIGWQAYRVDVRKGLTLNLNGEIWNHTLLGQVIAERAADAVLPATVRQVESGGTVRFGPIHVDRSGVRCLGQSIPWAEMLSISFGMNPLPQGPEKLISNMVHLRLNASCEVELGQVANYRLFEKVVLHFQPACFVAGPG